MLVRCILSEWAKEENPTLSRVIEDELSDDKIKELNSLGYNIYYTPNYASHWQPGITGSAVDGSHIDTFTHVYVDMDLKDGTYKDKAEFLERVSFAKLPASSVVDSGNGIHVYWEVSDLDAMSFLRLQRRLCRFFRTDDAVCKIYQLMRLPGTNNTKKKDAIKPCDVLESPSYTYTSEQLNHWLPKITKDDEEYCQNHYNRTYSIEQEIDIDENLPLKFAKLLKCSREVKELYTSDVDDRSKGDWELGRILHADGFTRAEAASVLYNCRKAATRSKPHRKSYAMGIVDKVWSGEDKPDYVLSSSSVKDILRKGVSIEGTKFPCWSVFDATHHGFRLTQVLGLIGGAGSGKTTLALNYFYWYVKLNPNYIHLFVSLEQPEEEVALRWVKMCGDNEAMHDRVHILSNYNPDGTYRNLSLSEIEEYVFALQKKVKCKVGCLVIDHIGVLKKRGKDGESQGLIDICHQMKAVAKNTNTFMVMQSQTSREKAGIGDVELDKDAAYGTSMFEWYCDWVVTTWQPLKRIYAQNDRMTCSAYKYCKLRHKNVKLDKIKEDSVQVLMFNPDNERLSVMTQEQDSAYDHWNGICNALRNKDRKREPTRRTTIDWGGRDK